MAKSKYAKFLDTDHEVKTFRWPYWLLPLLFLSLLLVLGLFIFITIHSTDRFGCFFQCEQKIDNGGVHPPRDAMANQGDQNDTMSSQVLKKDEKTKLDPQTTKNPMKTVPTTEKATTKPPRTNMTLTGIITFPKGKIPNAIAANSQLKVDLEDTSIQDASSVNIAETMVDLSSYKKGAVIKYVIECTKPEFAHDFYSVSAVLNMGWIPTKGNDDPWIKKGDYFTDTSFNVKITKEKSTYVKDIELVINE